MQSNFKSLSLVPLQDIPKAKDATSDDLILLYKLFMQLEYICTAENGIGLSAVQIGIPLKLFVISRNDQFEYYLNCEYQGNGDKGKSIEGCLSLKDGNGNVRRFEVDRYASVTIRGKRLKLSDSLSLTIEDILTTENGLHAVVFQHEIDHFEGRDKMIDNIGKEIELTI